MKDGPHYKGTRENYLYSLEIDIAQEHPQKDVILSHVWTEMMKLKTWIKEHDAEYVKASLY